MYSHREKGIKYIRSDKKNGTLTSLSVGFPLKNGTVFLLWGLLNLGLMNTAPLAIASKGAGPS